MWSAILNREHTTNLFIERKECAVDVQRKNLIALKEDMKKFREGWEEYYSKAKLAAVSMALEERDFPLRRGNTASESSPAEMLKKCLLRCYQFVAYGYRRMY